MQLTRTPSSIHTYTHITMQNKPQRQGIFMIVVTRLKRTSSFDCAITRAISICKCIYTGVTTSVPVFFFFTSFVFQKRKTLVATDIGCCQICVETAGIVLAVLPLLIEALSRLSLNSLSHHHPIWTDRRVNIGRRKGEQDKDYVCLMMDTRGHSVPAGAGDIMPDYEQLSLRQCSSSLRDLPDLPKISIYLIG